MTVNRSHSKTDGNHKEIREGLRALGFDVDDVYMIPRLYDMLVTGLDYRGRLQCVRVEVKMPGERLTPDEQAYWEKQKHRDNLIIAYRLEDVLAWFGLSADGMRKCAVGSCTFARIHPSPYCRTHKNAYSRTWNQANNGTERVREWRKKQKEQQRETLAA